MQQTAHSFLIILAASTSEFEFQKRSQLFIAANETLRRRDVRAMKIVR